MLGNGSLESGVRGLGFGAIGQRALLLRPICPKAAMERGGNYVCAEQWAGFS